MSSPPTSLALMATSEATFDPLAAAADRAGLTVVALPRDPRAAPALHQPEHAFRAPGGYLASLCQLGTMIRLAGGTPVWLCSLDTDVTGRRWRLVTPDEALTAVGLERHFVKLADDKHPAFPARRFTEPAQLERVLRRVHAADDTLLPPAAVLDVARLADGRFVVLEANQPWSSGLYGCDAAAVLTCLLAANHPEAPGHDERWLWRPDTAVFDLRWLPPA